MTKFIVTWDNFASNAGLSEGWWKTLTDKDRVKMIRQVEAHLDGFIERRKTGSPKPAVKVDPEFAKRALPILHGILASFDPDHKGLALAVLAGIFATKTPSMPVDEIVKNLRPFIKTLPDTLTLSGGPNPMVRRLKTEKGKPTGAEAFPPTKKPGRKMKSANGTVVTVTPVASA